MTVSTMKFDLKKSNNLGGYLSENMVKQEENMAASSVAMQSENTERRKLELVSFFSSLVYQLESIFT